nr:immunoglobulin light chain junction region [Macaca mulatta]MOX82157.1 immunoglobulin light chain junction region [Macaca mulatta]
DYYCCSYKFGSIWVF